MDLRNYRIVPQHRSKWHLSGMCAGLVFLTTGCPTVPLSGDGTSSGSGGSTTVAREIVNFTANFAISELDPAVSVLYNIEGTPDSISGFYVPVADNNPGALAIADRIIIANLNPGTNQFKFNPAVSGIGFFRVGIIVVEAGVELPAIESLGTVQVQGQPNPFFIQPPAESTTDVVKGDFVTIRFDAGDPEGDVQWRLFYLTVTDSRVLPADQLGTELALGRGNLGLAVLDTSTLDPGNYDLGVSATDTGQSIAATVAGGLGDRIVTVIGPFVRVVDATP